MLSPLVLSPLVLSPLVLCLLGGVLRSRSPTRTPSGPSPDRSNPFLSSRAPAIHGEPRRCQGFEATRRGSSEQAGFEGEALGLNDDRDDHRATPVGVIDPTTDPPTDDLLQTKGVVHSFSQRVLQRLDQQRPYGVKDRIVL